MTLTRLEMLELKAQDGLLTEDERHELAAAGIDVTPWVRGVVAEALLEGAGPTPDVVDAVLAEAVLAGADLEDDWPRVRAALREALLAPPTSGIADDVLAAIQAEEEDPELQAVGRLLRQAVLDEAGPAPYLWSGVLEGIDADPEWEATRELLRDAVHAEAGTASLADGVMAALEVGAAATASAMPDNVIELRPAAARAVEARPAAVPARPSRTWAQRYSLSIAGMAAAAALLLVFSAPIDRSRSAELSFDLSPVNHVEIEDISSDGDAMVQVLTFEEDAPTIIFIEEPDGAGSPVGGADEGAPL